MRRLVTIMAMPLIVAGCLGGGSTPPPPGATATAAPTAAATSTQKYAVATGADELILRIAGEGGFVAPEALLTRTPVMALYGDGRVIVAGANLQVSPAPLLPNLREMHVTATEIQAIVAAADEAGLLGPDASYAMANVADAGTTVFTTIVSGRVHVVSAYALGVPWATDTSDATVARAKLLNFENRVTDLSTFMGRAIGDDAYVPVEVRAFATAVPELDPSAQVLAWPAALDPATGVQTGTQGIRCVDLTGKDLTAFSSAAAGASQSTVWTAPSGHYLISVRPLYPDEKGCPPAAG